MDEYRDAVDDLQHRSGYTLAGAFAFGDSGDLADELLAFVERGTKRATAGSIAEYEAEKEPIPQPGAYFGLLDGRGRGRFVMQTTEVSVGRLDSVDAAFAWDEGEYDRTRESWLDGHRRYFLRQGIVNPDALELVFERFRVVWPIEDKRNQSADGVREVTVDDRGWVSTLLGQRYPAGTSTPDGLVDPARLPALLADRDGEPVGLLTFRPRPAGLCDVVTVDVFNQDRDVHVQLRAALDRLAQQERWSTVRG